MRLKINLQYDFEYKGFIVDCPSLPGCMSQGKTREEALKNIQKTAKEWKGRDIATVRAIFWTIPGIAAHASETKDVKYEPEEVLKEMPEEKEKKFLKSIVTKANKKRANKDDYGFFHDQD